MVIFLYYLETVVAKTGTVVHNALRPEKRFMQMPYLKVLGSVFSNISLFS